MNRLAVEFEYEWTPILKKDGNEYHFPEAVSTIKAEFNCRFPAVYRWNIYQNNRCDQKIVYIGETIQLYPDRINQYLKPGKKQATNERMNNTFREYLNNQFKIGLDVLSFEDINYGDHIIKYSDLANDHIRKFVESLFIVIHEKEGYNLLNK